MNVFAEESTLGERLIGLIEQTYATRFGGTKDALAVTAVGKEMARASRYLSLSCRIAAEIGAHFVKTYYCDDFEKVVKGCPVPLVIAGGPKLKTELDALKLAYQAVNEGAAGVDMGRNIWQSSNAIGMMKAIRRIVHENASVKEAKEILDASR